MLCGVCFTAAVLSIFIKELNWVQFGSKLGSRTRYKLINEFWTLFLSFYANLQWSNWSNQHQKPYQRLRHLSGKKYNMRFEVKQTHTELAPEQKYICKPISYLNCDRLNPKPPGPHFPVNNLRIETWIVKFHKEFAKL